MTKVARPHTIDVLERKPKVHQNTVRLLSGSSNEDQIVGLEEHLENGKGTCPVVITTG